MRTMRFTPKGYGGDRRAPDQIKREGWKEQGVWPSRSTTSG